MFSVSCSFSIPGHSSEHFKHAAMICSGSPCGMTGSVCLKSPPKTTVISPNGVFGLVQMSWQVWLNASAQNLFCLGTSSQIISLVLVKSFPKSEFLDMEQVVTTPATPLAYLLWLSLACLPLRAFVAQPLVLVFTYLASSHFLPFI